MAYVAGPFDSTHVYVQFGGKLPGNETWSCGFRMWQAGGSTTNQAASMMPGVAAAIRAFHERPETGTHQNAKLSFVKCNALNVNGRYQIEVTNELPMPDVAGGVTSNYYQANQVALAVSLTTGYSRGAAHRGRFYLPLPGNGPGTDGRISAGAAAAVAGSVDTLIEAVNDAGNGHEMVVMSRKSGAAGHRKVTGCEVGMVFDTQRRRRRSLIENYQG